MEHTEWLKAIAGTDSARTISKKSGVPNRTVLNQMDKGTISAENVIKIAEGYGKSPVRALVNTGYLDEEWAQSVDPETAIWQLTEEQIAEHVLERMKLPGTHQSFETPVDELAARRTSPPESTTAATTEQGTDEDTTPSVRTEGYDPLRHVAYSGEDEDEQRRRQENTDDFD
jgi:hypothetical protein